MNLSDHFAPAEISQLQAEWEAAEERRFRRKVWTCLAVWSVLAAVAWGAM